MFQSLLSWIMFSDTFLWQHGQTLDSFNPCYDGLINLLSKIDIRISTEPVIVGKEFYYKIWILKKEQKIKHILKITIL